MHSNMSCFIWSVVIEKDQVNRKRFKGQTVQIFDDTVFWEFYELLSIRDKVSLEIIKMIHTDLVSTQYFIQENYQKIKKFLHFS